LTSVTTGEELRQVLKLWRKHLGLRLKRSRLRVDCGVPDPEFNGFGAEIEDFATCVSVIKAISECWRSAA
jgi:hypothetical protein